jgi:hypothetical protein
VVETNSGNRDSHVQLAFKRVRAQTAPSSM